MQDIVDSALRRIDAAASVEELEAVRVQVLGRKDGVITQLSRDMGKLPAEARVARGKFINSSKQALETAYERRKEAFDRAAMAQRLDAEWIDLTVPALGVKPGSLHPVTQI